MKYNNKNFLYNFFIKRPIFSEIKINCSLLVKIIKVNKSFVVVDANLKSLSFINIQEFLIEGINTKYLKGMYIPVLIESLDKGNGSLILSRDKYLFNLFWGYLKFILKEKIIIYGLIINKIKGGFHVMVSKFRCFLPFSGIDKRVLLNVTFYKNRSLPFRIINFNFKKRNIILSRKVLIKLILIKKKRELIEFLKPGFIVKGIVKNITNYCIYIDLGYLEGVVLSKNITWGHFKNSNEILQIGQGISARVLSVVKENLNIFLGIKQLYKNPWKNIFYKYKVGEIKYVRIYKIINDNVHVVFERGVFSFIKKMKLFEKYVDEKIINNLIKVNNYLKVKINYINIKKKFINFKLYKIKLYKMPNKTRL